jgi:hypothetical protein
VAFTVGYLTGGNHDLPASTIADAQRTA